MKRFRLCLVFLWGLGISAGYGQRVSYLLNEGWNFRFSHQVERGSAVKISLPHTWNAQDALSGRVDYKRGIGNYERQWFVDRQWQGKRLFLRFEGVNNVADVFVNGRFVGEHKGGYSAFVFEVTDYVEYGRENSLLVRVNNAERLDVMPLVGDFNMYGGIYRDVQLIVTQPTCISLTDYASPGVYLTQTEVTPQKAKVSAEVVLSSQAHQKVRVRVEVKDGDQLVTRCEQGVVLDATPGQRVVLPFEIHNPRLWDGRTDPFMYRAVVTVWQEGKKIDEVVQPLGLRNWRVDANRGFYLNGRHLKLHGVCRHQDRPEIGNALRPAHHEEDAQIMLEMGANAVRLAHYQQSEYFYDLMDKYGLVVWAEIPFVGPGGYLDKGFVDSPDFKENGKNQLRELIRQNYNHPSICFWGMFNELTEQGDNPVGFVKELNELAHAEDPYRPTTAASNQQGKLNGITDCIAWNRYDGWYGNGPKDLAVFLDETHKKCPELCIGISEYGAGASIYHQQDTLVRPVPVSFWHPENWQTYYHIENWKILKERDFVWGSFIWNLFDFGAAHRHEGDRVGINDKGLVTFDRKIKKDAFYFYKANWNPEPMVYLVGKRNRSRSRRVQEVMAFTNLPEVELWVNGALAGKQVPDEYAVVRWNNVILRPGENLLEVRSVNGSPVYRDTCVVELVASR